ncbi:hypothetical protein ACFW9U_26735 [Rhodococcus aetherivorans]|uniref:T4 family baseplate hub assembly chaperone n=1 Tax=Rhodococcus aetherivorans TaxID=191292 RepID=UPI00366BC565
MQTALRVPTAAQLLDIWESGIGADPPQRALLLLAVLCDTPAGDLGALPIGQRNSLLLHARMLLFGTGCDTVADCPKCGAELEADLPVPALLTTAEQPTGAPATGELVTGGYAVQYRVPTAEDLTVVASGPVEDAARELFGRCVLSAHSGSRELSWTDLPEEVTRLVEQAMAQADPDALVEVELTCPACAQPVALPLDPASLLWAEVERWAGNTLREVHELAAAYGWHEHCILAMSATRRQTYLAMSGAAGASA